MKSKNRLKEVLLIVLLVLIGMTLVGCSARISSQHDDKTITLNAVEDCYARVRVMIQNDDGIQTIERYVWIYGEMQTTVTIEELAPEEHFSENAVITEFSIQEVATPNLVVRIIFLVFFIMPLFLSIVAVLMHQITSEPKTEPH